MVFLMSAASWAKVTELKIEHKTGGSYTGTVTGYQYSYQINAVVVRIFAAENNTRRKMTAILTFQAGNNHDPNPQILMNALSNTPDSNFEVRVFNADGHAMGTAIAGMAVIGDNRPSGGIEITSLN